MLNFDRQAAEMAANTVWRRGGNCSSSAADIRDKLLAEGRETLEANLLAELAVTDKVECSTDQALKMLRAQYARQQGRCRGGVMTSVKRRHSAVYGGRCPQNSEARRC